MLEYAAKAASVWFIGFFPFFEIYLAIPAGVVLGLDYISTVFWSVFGNYTPVLLIHFGYAGLMRVPRLARWMNKLTSQRLQRLLDRYGPWIVLLVTPWIGVWAMAVTMRALGMDSNAFLLYSFISIATYGIALAALLYLGVDLAFGQ